MKLVKKAIRSAKVAHQRQKAGAERGKLGPTYASFFDALPTTAPGAENAFASAAVAAMNLLGMDRTLTDQTDLPDLAQAAVAVNLSDGAAGAIPEAVGDSAAFGLWLERQAGPALFRGLQETLPTCAALHVTFQGPRRGDKTSDAINISEYLMAHGFEPVLRSAGHGKGLFRVLFLRRDLIAAHVTPLSQLIDQACDPAAPGTAADHRDIPIYIPCFNNQTYCKTMIAQLHAWDFTNITLIDNASTNPEMHRFLDTVEKTVKVDRLKENLGPKNSVFTPERYAEMPRYFCVTDPDIVFNPFLPKDFIAQLIDQTRRHKIGKAGFALDISHRQFFADTVVKLLWQEWTIWEWEERFWTDQIGRTRSHDPVYKADLDTTFALYDKEQWVREDFCRSVRVAGRFTAGHAPWYAQSDVPQDERDAYRNESAYSYYKM